MSSPFMFALIPLNERCQRAARYRRSLVDDPALTPADLERLIRFAVPLRGIPADTTTWVRISTLLDDHAGVHFAIWWHPPTDRVGLVAPPPKAPRTPHLWPALQQVGQLGVGSPFRADPGYIYTYHGVDYYAKDAEDLAAELGSSAGWTWRPR